MASVLALAAAQSAPAQTVDFARDIQPILETACLSCHGAAQALGGLRLDSLALALKGGVSGPSLVARDPERSPLYTRSALPAGDARRMPPGEGLSADRLAALRNWIAQGAPWPPEIRLRARKQEPAGSLDEQELVRRLHARIAAHSRETEAGEMAAYRTVIPGSSVAFEMLPIPAGEFRMGSPESEPGRQPDEGPVHAVELDAFWMGKHEVTWDKYRLFMYYQQGAARDLPGETAALVDAVSKPTRPYVEMSFGMGIDGYPAISMTQHAANKYCQWLSSVTGHFYRLPTEAEWEYACRAGTTTAYSFGDDPAALGEYAWYFENSSDKYQKVGQKKPNPWGLHDMHGNVMEWTLDQYLPHFYQTFAKTKAVNPWAKADKPYPHAVRGGSWNDDPDRLRCAARVASDPSWKIQDPQLPKSIWYHTDAQWLGFRVVRPLKVPSADEMYRYWNSGVEKE